MILQSTNNNCVMTAISTVRASLGYEEPFEPGLPIQFPTEMFYILKYKDKFFPNNKVELFFSKSVCQNLIKDGHMTIDNLSPFIEDFFNKKDIESNRFICIFDYTTINSNLGMTHTVIGYPTYLYGMVGQYILKVYIDYQLELEL